MMHDVDMEAVAMAWKRVAQGLFDEGCRQRGINVPPEKLPEDEDGILWALKLRQERARQLHKLHGMAMRELQRARRLREVEA